MSSCIPHDQSRTRRLGYLQAHEEAQERLHRGERQQCGSCGRWYWPADEKEHSQHRRASATFLYLDAMDDNLRSAVVMVLIGALFLVVGLILSQTVTANVNRTGAKIGCFDGVTKVKDARYDGDLAATNSGVTNLPKHSTGLRDGGSQVEGACGVGTMTEIADGEPSFSARQGSIEYVLGVYGADSLNGLMTIMYFVMFVGAAVGLIGGGGYIVMRAASL